MKKRLFLIFGIRRSGNHAITLWLTSNEDPKNTLIKFNQPPYRELDYITNRVKKIKQIKLVIITYENKRIDKKEPIIFKEEDFGKREKKHILILRDPFNTFASMIRRYNNAGRRLNLHQTKDIWKQYAREVINTTNYLNDKMFINYNFWVQSETYRDKIAKKLGLTPDKDKVEHVPHNGEGSSFDGTEYDGKAFQMDVFNRWKCYIDDEKYKSLFKDKELIELSTKLFGPVDMEIEKYLLS